MTHIINLQTKIVFGKNALKELPQLLKKAKATKVLIVYGQGSVKRNKILEKVTTTLKQSKFNFGEFGGIEPNPRHTTINHAATIVKKENYDFILGIGGGSVTDATKVIAATASHDWDSCWDLVQEKVKITNPIMKCGAITTLAGTASENNAGSVITNANLRQKYPTYTQAPIFAIENPEFTFSVSKWQTASGAFDCFSHIIEQYYGAKPFDYSDNIAFALLKTLIKNVPIALNDPTSYRARENLLITTAFALNGVFNFKQIELGSDWMVHSLEHSISALWDVTHGAGLALITPYYLNWAIKKSKDFYEKTRVLGIELFGINSAENTIIELEKMIKQWGLPRKYSDFKEIKQINEEQLSHLVEHTKNNGALKMTKDEIRNIFKSIKL